MSAFSKPGAKSSRLVGIFQVIGLFLVILSIGIACSSSNSEEPESSTVKHANGTTIKWSGAQSELDYMWAVCSSRQPHHTWLARANKCCKVRCPFALSPFAPEWFHCGDLGNQVVSGGWCVDGQVESTPRVWVPEDQASVKQRVPGVANCTGTIEASASHDIGEQWASEGAVAANTNLIFGTIYYRCRR